MTFRKLSGIVIPAKAGIKEKSVEVDSRFRDCMKILFKKLFVKLSRRTELVEVLTKPDKIKKFSKFLSPFSA